MSWYIAVLKKYVVFEGRARRKEYWMFVLFNAIFAAAASILDSLLGTGNELGTGLIYNLYLLAMILPSLAVSVRRLHDVGKSGWFLLISLIPIIGFIWIFVLACLDGTPGPNKYGPNPKETELPMSDPQQTPGNASPPEKTELAAASSTAQLPATNIPDQLIRLAELKDAGVITQEEFDLKKQEFLEKM